MNDLITCPSCGADIDADSRFCDMCGNELMICPSCRSACKSKFCSKCGKPSVKATELTDSKPAPPAPPEPVPAPVGPKSLVCKAMGVTLPLKAGAVIGRVTGDYTDRLSTFQYLSGTHARIDFDGTVWSLTDLGSRNGTTVNGIACSPAARLKKGDTVRFAKFYDFTVE